MIKHISFCVQLTTSHLCKDVSYFCAPNCSICVHCMTLCLSFLLSFRVSSYLRGCTVLCKSCDDKKRQNISLWNDKTAMIPRFCLWICFILMDALQSSKGGTSCVNQIEPDNCLIHLQPMFVPEVRNNSLLHSCISGKNCKCLQENKVPRHPEASLSLSLPRFLSLFWCTPQTTPYIKNPFLSYLSSCFRYFCKLQGARIINHCETRWQSASIVTKKTNETTHPGKWPADLVWYWLPTVTEMWYTGSLSRTVSHDAPWAGQSQIRPQRQTNVALCLFVPLWERKLISDLAWFCLKATENIIILSEKRDRTVCYCEPVFPVVIHV